MSGIEERLSNPDDLPWARLAEGIDFRLLYTSAETGRWTVLLRAQAGSSIARHKHYGAGEYFVVKGRMDYRMGTAVEGAYGYEPLDVIHDLTRFPVYTELYFTNYGPVAFLADDGSILSMLDHIKLAELSRTARVEQ